MVNFETEVYNRQEDDVIGVKIIVVADTGQTIDSIRCVNETDFQEIQDKLDVLDESYVVFAPDSSLAGLNIDTILENENESAIINATSLGGYQSDYYSKTNHQHLKSHISDLYNYDISLNKYNLNLDDSESVTVTVKVTDSSNSPVASHVLTIYKNGSLWKSNVRTNSKGVYTATFTPTDVGIITFAVNNQKIQCLVNGWEEIPITPGAMSFFVNESLRLAELRVTNTNAAFRPEGDSPHYPQAIPEQYCPKNQIFSLTYYQEGRIEVASNGSIYFTTSKSTIQYNKNASCTLLWHY